MLHVLSPSFKLRDIFLAPRQCIICGKLATLECLQCYGDHGTDLDSKGLDSTAFCESCLTPNHNHHRRRSHKTPTQLQVPPEYLANRYIHCDAIQFKDSFPAFHFFFRTSDTTPRLFMELFAVVCIETSHYVSFVKCGLGPDAPWCFFDSMADRRGE